MELIQHKFNEDQCLSIPYFNALKIFESFYNEAIQAEKSNWITKWETNHNISDKDLKARVRELEMEKENIKKKILSSRERNLKITYSFNIK